MLHSVHHLRELVLSQRLHSKCVIYLSLFWRLPWLIALVASIFIQIDKYKYMTITIKGNEYNVKYTIRSMFIFEKITKKQFKIDSLMDWYILYYCIILANNMDTTLTFDEFIDACDDDTSIVTKMQSYLSKVFEQRAMFANDKDDTDIDVKKS